MEKQDEPVQPAQTESQPTESARPKARLNRGLAIFLIFPIAGIGVSLMIALQGQRFVDPVPPTVLFTPDTLINTTAPDFALKTPDGGTVGLASLRGQWVFLNFWATWCPPCREELPLFQRMIKGEFDGTGATSLKGRVTLLAVDDREAVADVNAFLTQQKVQIPVALDPDGAVNNRYRIINLPVTYLIDPNGVIRYQQIGQMTEQLLSGYLDYIRKQTF